MEVGGHALCTFHLTGAWAVAEVGAVYEPARKATSATTVVATIANLKGTSVRMGHPSVGRRPAVRRPVEVFAASEKWRESMQAGARCQYHCCALSCWLMRAVSLPNGPAQAGQDPRRRGSRVSRSASPSTAVKRELGAPRPLPPCARGTSR